MGESTKYVWIGVGALALIVALLVVSVIPFPYTAIEQYEVKEPYSSLESSAEQEPYVSERCALKTYDSHWEWQEGSTDDEYSTPRIELANQEDRPGAFRVEFAFYDTDYTPYTNASSADWEDAHMYSEEKSFSFSPYERRIIEIPTPKKREDAHYWWRARITPPEYNDCTQTTEYRTVTRQQTVTRYHDTLRERPVTLYATLLQRWTGNARYYLPARGSDSA